MRACSNAYRLQSLHCGYISSTQTPCYRATACSGFGSRCLPAQMMRQTHKHALLSQMQRNLTKTRAQAGSVGADAPIPPEADTASQGASFSQAVFSVLNVVMGVGLLSVPLALSKSGFAGVLVLVVLGFIANYTGKELCRCARTVGKMLGRPPKSMVRYEEIAEAAFGNFGRQMVSVMMYTELVGTCSLFLILESDNVWNLVGSSAAQSSIAANFSGFWSGVGSLLSTHQGVFWLCALLIVPTVWARDVQSLSILGLCGFVATLTVSCAVAWTFFTGDFVTGAQTLLVDWQGIPLVLGILAFCYSGHSVFPSIQNAMAEPERFPKVLDCSIAIVGTLCSCVGAAGYFMYGNGAMDVITFNLSSRLKFLCAAVILVNPIAKFAITMEPVALGARHAAAEALKMQETYWFRCLVNTIVAFCIVMVAKVVPYLSIVMSLVGALLTISISITIPTAASYVLHRKEMDLLEKLWAFTVILIGVVCATSGTASAVLALKSVLGSP